MSPPPAEMLHALVARGRLTAEEAQLAARVPLAEDVTVEADSGGHTDNRPLGALLPVIARLRDALSAAHGYPSPAARRRRRRSRHAGVGGGGVRARRRLRAHGQRQPGRGRVGPLRRWRRSCSREPDVADVAMAAAADMFELGVKLQVLKRGTLFAARAPSSTRSIATTRRSTRSRPTSASTWRRRSSGPRSTRSGRQTRAFWRRARARAARARDARSQAPHGARVPLVPRQVEPLGHRRRARATGRLPDLVRPGDGRVQRLGQGQLPRGPGVERSVVQIALNLLEGAAVLDARPAASSVRGVRSRPPPSTSAPALADFAYRGLTRMTTPESHARCLRRCRRSPSSASARSFPARATLRGFWRRHRRRARSAHRRAAARTGPATTTSTRRPARPTRSTRPRAASCPRSTSRRSSSACRRTPCRRPTRRSCSRSSSRKRGPRGGDARALRAEWTATASA